MKIVSNSFVLLIFIQIIRINFIFIFIKKFYNFYDIIIDDIYVYIYIYHLILKFLTILNIAVRNNRQPACRLRLHIPLPSNSPAADEPGNRDPGFVP